MTALINDSIGVVGAGAWGQALAQSFARTSRQIILWGRSVDHLGLMPDNIKKTNTLEDLTTCNILFMAVPTQFLRTVLQRLKPQLLPATPFVLCCKGVEISSALLPHQIVREECSDHDVCVLTGPSFALDVMNNRPVALTLAAHDLTLARKISETISSTTLRTYLCDDLIGAEIGGAVKNVIAIACGILDGMKLGESARAALMTRGLAEMARLACVMGGKRETLMGLSGAGDLILTCTSATSRNYSLGFKLGQGEKLDLILAAQKGVTEGLHTAKSIRTLSERHNVDMPISTIVYEFLHADLDLRDAVTQILNRPLREERE